MKVVSISVLRFSPGMADPLQLCMATDLSSFGFFQRQGLNEMLTFFSQTFVKRTQSGQRQSVKHESYIVHCYLRPDGLAGCVTTDEEYPARVAFVMLSQALDEFQTDVGVRWKDATQPDSISFPKLEEYLQKYQDPTSADKITKIQKDLDETTEILHKTIDSVLERGVKLDDLVDRSNVLSSQSKMFYKQAKKTNSCCIIS
mmetsp:Transcript_16978/g.38199  ORF Transcript_16978/g.38199 Transcript_16978/m.38199 type:complete len:201 (-) Transcript_16978:318-920(-)